MSQGSRSVATKKQSVLSYFTGHDKNTGLDYR